VPPSHKAKAKNGLLPLPASRSSDLICEDPRKDARIGVSPPVEVPPPRVVAKASCTLRCLYLPSTRSRIAFIWSISDCWLEIIFVHNSLISAS
jgi:hypothetical protein